MSIYIDLTDFDEVKDPDKSIYLPVSEHEQFYKQLNL